MLRARADANSLQALGTVARELGEPFPAALVVALQADVRAFNALEASKPATSLVGAGGAGQAGQAGRLRATVAQGALAAHIADRLATLAASSRDLCSKHRQVYGLAALPDALADELQAVVGHLTRHPAAPLPHRLLALTSATGAGREELVRLLPAALRMAAETLSVAHYVTADSG